MVNYEVVGKKVVQSPKVINGVLEYLKTLTPQYYKNIIDIPLTSFWIVMDNFSEAKMKLRKKYPDYENFGPGDAYEEELSKLDDEFMPKLFQGVIEELQGEWLMDILGSDQEIV